MSKSHGVFAKTVNDLMDDLLKHEIAEAEAELIQKGIKADEIKRILAIAKAKAQAQMLPTLKKLVRDKIEEECKSNPDEANNNKNSNKI